MSNNGNGTVTGVQPVTRSLAYPNEHGGNKSVIETKPSGQYIYGVPLTFYSDLDREGFDFAVRSGSLKELPEHKEALAGKARAAARETRRDPFDASQHEHDRLRDAEFQKLQRDRDEVEEERRHAEAELAGSDREVAKVETHTRPPKKPSLGMKMIIAGLVGLTVMPTLHDFIFVVRDEVMAWMGTIIAALLLGAGLVVLMFWDAESSEQSTAINRLGLAAGLVIALGLGLLRFSGAISWSDYLLTAGFTLMEVGLVLAIEMVAGRYRAAFRKWEAEQAVLQKARAHREAVAGLVQRCREREAVINSGIQQHIAHVELRISQAKLTVEIEETAVQTILAGYSRGIAHKRGQIMRGEGGGK